MAKHYLYLITQSYSFVTLNQNKVIYIFFLQNNILVVSYFGTIKLFNVNDVFFYLSFPKIS